MVDLTVEPRFIDVIKKLLRCEGVKYTTAIIDLQVTNLVIIYDGPTRRSTYLFFNHSASLLLNFSNV